MKRYSWIDLIKIISIYLVIVLHIVNNGVSDKQTNISLLFYYIGTLAIPLFFITNGYLHLTKERDYKYCLKKILRIIVIVFIFSTLVQLIKLVIKGQNNNILHEFLYCFLQKGSFPQFWFFGSLIIIYLFLPLLCKLFKSNKSLYFTIIMCVICIIINGINIYNYNSGSDIIIHRIIQTFRLWTWLTYFFLGGFLRKIDILKKIDVNKKVIIMIIMISVMIIYEYFFSMRLYGNMYAENFYDSIIVLLTSIVTFITFKEMNIKENKIINTMGSLTIGVYAIHGIIINILGTFLLLNNNFINIGYSIVVFIISMIISYIIYKVPIINQLIKI